MAIRDDSEEYQSSQDEDEREEDQQFHVDDAEPPTNYDDAYSDLPAKIKLQNIKVRRGYNRMPGLVFIKF